MTDTRSQGLERYYADVSSRAVAHLLDAIVVSLLAFIAAIVVSAALGPVVRFHSTGTGVHDRITVNGARAAIDGAVTTVITMLYFALSWTRWARTPGQRLLGIDVRRIDGARVRPAPAIVRWLLLVAPLSFVSAAISLDARVGLAVVLAAGVWYLALVVSSARNPMKRGLHDRVVATVVTKAGHPVDPSRYASSS
jgi:uncharacterized RDD family membrane protein YckC